MKTILWTLLAATTLCAQTPVGNTPSTQFKPMPFNDPSAGCKGCHPRQYLEMRQAVKSGYRNVSPLFNSLELATNFLTGGIFRPTYADSDKVLADGTKLNTNMFTTPVFKNIRQMQSGYCYSCHNSEIERMGDDPNKREVPELAGVEKDFRPDLIRPLRDYHLVDSDGNQVLPDTFGGPAPDGTGNSLGANGIQCDSCHNTAGPDLHRSPLGDGYANMGMVLVDSIEKVGQFNFPAAVKGNFHVASRNPDKMQFINSSAFCASCHDVRIPLAGPGDLQHAESNPDPAGSNINTFRLENLSTEYVLGPYNTTNNPFGKVVKCHDCHTSLFPFTAKTSYKLGNTNVTVATPGIYPVDFAAVPGTSTEFNYPLMQRPVSTHFFTGADVPLMDVDELRTRVAADFLDFDDPTIDEHGMPLAMLTRRRAQLDSAVRLSLTQTDAAATLGSSFKVRAEAVALTGHRFPAGLSEERTTYIQLSVTDANGFVVYQSGYLVDKPHPETGETDADGNLDDEDLEHLHVVVDPGHHTDVYKTGEATNGHTNQIFETGPDDGPDARVYGGAEEGLVLFRNELTRIFLPGEAIGRVDANGNALVAKTPHWEETFGANNNTVDNYRSLMPLAPRTFRYTITLPSQAELDEMGVKLQGPLKVHAQINYEQFPPVFMRFLARTTSAAGPSGNAMGLLDESTIDTFLKNITAIATADFTINLKNN